MRFFHYLGDRVWKLDAWILDRFQYLANLAYTRWDTSPYALAARCFHVAGGFGIVGIGLIMTGKIGNDVGRTPLAYILLFMFLVVVFFESGWAHKKHVRWKAHKLPNAPGDERIPVLRKFWMAMVVYSMVIIMIQIMSRDIEFRNWIGMGVDIGFMSAFYFLSCAPPTRLEKKQDQHIRDMVPSMS